jgi:hypothetical protein
MQPQTDLEQYKSMLSRARIEFKEEELDGDVVITVERGYFGFYCSHTFHQTGELKDVASYE